MWVKQNDTSKIQEKQKNASKVQEKHVKYIESNPSFTTNTFYCHQKLSASANLATFRVKKCMEFQAL
jgi:hypothetical protein